MKPHARPRIVAAMWVFVSGACAAAQPAESPPPAEPSTPPALVEPTDADVAESLHAAPSPWRVELSTWVWLLGMEGDISAHGRSINVSADFGDILEASDSLFAFSGRLELGHGRLAGYIDGMYAEIGADNQSGPLGIAQVDLRIRQTIVDVGAMYRVLDHEPTGAAASNARRLTIDLYAGARLADIDVSLDPLLTASTSQGKTLIDPVIGVKAVVPLAQHWHLAINADIGGFGAASDFVWSATALVGYDFHIARYPASVLLGYRAMAWDYSGGDTGDEFVWQVVQHGLLLGFTIQF